MAGDKLNNNDAVYNAAMQVLEPIVVGLLSGQKKLVIETRIHGDCAFREYDHTIKIVDC